MQIFLNGGNFGGLGITVPDSTLNILVQTSPTELWNYDTKIHPNTATADYVGMVNQNDSLVSATTSAKLDMQGL